MGKTWNRNVTYDSAEDCLVISLMGTGDPNGPSDPNAPPNHKPRYDTELEIATYTSDRAGNGPAAGAKIQYHAKGKPVVKLTGITMKNGGPVPPELTWTVSGNSSVGSGKLLRLTDKGPAKTERDYYVWGTVASVAKRTKDPKLRNHAQ